MKIHLLVPAVAGAALLSLACSQAPSGPVNEAKLALENARTAEAADFAPEAFAAAETAAAALDAELKAQNEKFALTRSYSKANELAATASAKAHEAAMAAANGRERAKGEAATLSAGVRAAIDNARAAIDRAPRGKGSAADLEAMRSDVAGVEASLGEIDAAVAAGKYRDARVKAEAAKQTLDRIVADVQAAVAMKKTAGR